MTLFSRAFKNWFAEWVQSLVFVTQSSHFFAGIAIILAFHLWFDWYWATFFLVLWIILKEFGYDKVWWGENHQWPDYLDALFYALGGLTALLLLGIKGC